MLEKPEVWGAQELSSKEVTMRLVAKTTPMRQWEVARELRARVKATLDAAASPRPRHHRDHGPPGPDRPIAGSRGAAVRTAQGAGTAAGTRPW